MKKIFHGPLGPLVTLLVYWIGQAGTKEEAEAAYTFLASDISFEPFKDKIAKVTEYLRRRENEFAGYLLLKNGIANYGVKLSNAAEQVNSSAGGLRRAPIIELIHGLVFQRQADWIRKRNEVANSIKTGITPNVLKKMRITFEEGEKLRVKISWIDSIFAEGVVTVGLRHFSTVRLIYSTGAIICPCKKELLICRPCVTAAALFAELKRHHAT